MGLLRRFIPLCSTTDLFEADEDPAIFSHIVNLKKINRLKICVILPESKILNSFSSSESVDYKFFEQ